MVLFRIMENFDIIGLTKTWLEKEAGKKLSNRASKKFNWLYITDNEEENKRDEL